MNRITVYCTQWCLGCHMAKRFFDTHDIEYDYIDINQDSEAKLVVENINNGDHSVPTIVFPDGSTLVEPSGRQLAEKLGVSQG